MTAKRVSLADVARLAGVSSNTVSRVVRNDPEVSAATRDRIQQLLAELDYRPNLAARALANSRTGVIHVLLATPMYYGHAQTFLAITNAASDAGFYVSVSHLRDIESVSNYRDLTPINVDGVIIIGGEDPVVELATNLGNQMPTVLVLAGEHGLDNVSTVSVDNVLGSKLAAEHLIAGGAKNLAHLAGPLSWVDAEQRQRGFINICQANNLEPKIISADSWDAVAGYEAVSSWGITPDGIFAANDQLALGAARALLEAGVKIPEQTQLVGYDDSASAPCFFPPLTTVRQDCSAIGQLAVNELTELFEDMPTRDVVIKPALVVRASSIS